MKQRTRHIVILGVVVALVAAAIFFIYPPNKKTHLGLDLQGGLEVIFQAKTTTESMSTVARPVRTNMRRVTILRTSALGLFMELIAGGAPIRTRGVTEGGGR